MACLTIIKTEEYIHSAPGTPHDGIDTYIYAGRTWTYRVYREPETLLSSNEYVYLSYAGSTVTNGIEFSSPVSVTIPANINYIDFELTVNVHDNVYQKFINIEASSETHNSCGRIINQILSYKSTPSYYQSNIIPCTNDFVPEEIDTCHDYFKYYPANYPEVY